ncbi:MAG: hypothetical protein AABX29_07160 [Nanoarchaeota archaeon]
MVEKQVGKQINDNRGGIRWLFHFAAVVCFIYSFYVFSGYISETIYQDQYILTMRIRYLLMAIFMEMTALNFK